MFFRSGLVGFFGEIVVAMVVVVNFLCFCLFEPFVDYTKFGNERAHNGKHNENNEIMITKHAKRKGGGGKHEYEKKIKQNVKLNSRRNK